MSLGAIDAVRARMSAIESRFAPRSAPVRTTVTVGRDFDAVLRGADRPPPATGAPVGAPANPPFASAATDGVGTTWDPSGTAVGRGVAVPLAIEGALDPSTPFAAVFDAAGAAYGVPPRLLAAVGWVESRYQVGAVSPAGAIGLMQLMPETAASLRVDPTDPASAIDGAARLLASHHQRFGSWDLAIAAYHSGPGAIAGSAGGSLPPRAAEYVRRVAERLEGT